MGASARDGQERKRYTFDDFCEPCITTQWCAFRGGCLAERLPTADPDLRTHSARSASSNSSLRALSSCRRVSSAQNVADEHTIINTQGIRFVERLDESYMRGEVSYHLRVTYKGDVMKFKYPDARSRDAQYARLRAALETPDPKVEP